jgi:hypothetical protein
MSTKNPLCPDDAKPVETAVVHPNIAAYLIELTAPGLLLLEQYMLLFLPFTAALISCT